MCASGRVACVLAAAVGWINATARAADEPPQGMASAIHVQVVGQGPPMILIPGLACGTNIWEQTLAHYKGRFTCHVVTLAGFAGNPSVQPPLLEQVRDALVRYIDEKELDKPVIVGHSLGGFLAYWAAIKAPDKVGPIIAVDGVPYLTALVTPQATADSIVLQATLLRQTYESMTAEQFVEATRQSLASMITDPKHLDKVMEQAGRSDPKAVGAAIFELFTTDLREKVKVIQSPVLLIGSTSLIESEAAREQAEKAYREQVKHIPKHKIVLTAKARQFIQLDDPKFLHRQIDAFLEAEAKQ